MYFEAGTRDGVPHYITSRGSSQLENFWKCQEKIFTHVASARVVNAALTDFVLFWNLNKHFRACGETPPMTLDLGLLDELEEMESELFGRRAFAGARILVPDARYGTTKSSSLDSQAAEVDRGLGCLGVDGLIAAGTQSNIAAKNWKEELAKLNEENRQRVKCLAQSCNHEKKVSDFAHALVELELHLSLRYSRRGTPVPLACRTTRHP